MEILDDVKPLSEKLTPKPLKGDEKAVFRLLSIGKKEGGRDEPTAPEIVQLSAVEMVMDPYDPQHANKPKKMGTFVVEHKQVQNQLKPVYKAPQFIRGYCTVRADENPLYVRLLRSKNCVSNKFRKQMGRGKDLFELVEDRKEINDQIHLADLRWHAESIVRKADWTALKATSTKLNESPDERLHVKTFVAGVREDDLQGMKLELISKAQLYPKQVIAASGDKEAYLKVQVFEGMSFGVIIFQDGAYHMLGKNDMVEIHAPDKDKEPIDSLVGYLMSAEGKKHYAQFAQELAKIMAPKT